MSTQARSVIAFLDDNEYAPPTIDPFRVTMADVQAAKRHLRFLYRLVAEERKEVENLEHLLTLLERISEVHTTQTEESTNDD
jgi:hypothetical protein